MPARPSSRAVPVSLLLVLLLVTMVRGQALTLDAFEPSIWQDPLSGGRISVTTEMRRVDGRLPAVPLRWLWRYTVTNVSYRPEQGAGLRGFVVSLSAALDATERVYLPPPQGWIDNDSQTTDPALLHPGSLRHLEWAATTGGLLPGQSMTLEVATYPRAIEPEGQGEGHTFIDGVPDYRLFGTLVAPGRKGRSLAVLFIPGFGGSELDYQDPGSGARKTAWPDRLLNSRILNPGGADPLLLQCAANGSPRIDTPSFSVQAPRMLAKITDQEAMVQELSRNGFVVKVFPYDFRRPVDVSARRLADFIAAEYPTGSFHIVAHSMGGLVAKAYLRDHPNDHQVESLTTLGTPHLGSPKAFRVLRYGDSPKDVDLYLFTVKLFDECAVRRTLHNWPGLYDLLPSRLYFERSPYGGYLNESLKDLDGNGAINRIDDFEAMVNILKTDPETNTACPLEQADAAPHDTLSPQVVDEQVVALHDELDVWQKPPDCEVFVVAGSGVKTLTAIRQLSRNRVKDTTSTLGDGTVPLWSGLECEVTQHYTANLGKLKAQHLSMLSNKEVQKQVIGLLRLGEGVHGKYITRTAAP